MDCHLYICNKPREKKKERKEEKSKRDHSSRSIHERVNFLFERRHHPALYDVADEGSRANCKGSRPPSTQNPSGTGKNRKRYL